tara:strand:+ start:390 stop:854 length:465 start_codon:yes stop_codon:yes gene_type:complete
MEFKLRIVVNNESSDKYIIDYCEFWVIKKVTLDLLKQVRAYTEVPSFPPSEVRFHEDDKNKLLAYISRVQTWPDKFLQPRDVQKLTGVHFEDSNIAEVETDMETLEKCCELEFTEYRCDETGRIEDVLLCYVFNLETFMNAWSGYDYSKKFSLK